MFVYGPDFSTAMQCVIVRIDDENAKERYYIRSRLLRSTCTALYVLRTMPFGVQSLDPAGWREAVEARLTIISCRSPPKEEAPSASLLSLL